MASRLPGTVTLRRLLQFGEDLARDAYRGSNALMTTIYATTRGGDIVTFTVNMDNSIPRSHSISQLQGALASMKAIHYVVVCEAWYRPGTDAIDPNKLPDSKDYEERLVLIAVNRKGSQIRQFRILRDDRHGVRGLDIVPDTEARLGSWLEHLLPLNQ